MKPSCALALALSVVLSSPAFAQVELLNGHYTTLNGELTVKLTKQDDGTIEVVDPWATSIYRKVGNVWESNVSKYGSVFTIQVTGPKKFIAGKKGAPNRTKADVDRNTFELREATGEKSRLEQGDGGPGPEGTHHAVFESYKNRIKSDPANTHMWAACGAAALARSLLNDEAANEYATLVAASIKPIMTNPGATPCENAIPKKLWSASK